MDKEILCYNLRIHLFDFLFERPKLCLCAFFKYPKQDLDMHFSHLQSGKICYSKCHHGGGSHFISLLFCLYKNNQNSLHFFIIFTTYKVTCYYSKMFVEI